MNMRDTVFGFVLGLLLFAGAAYASGNDISGGILEGPWPEGVDVWTVDGRIFVRDSVTDELLWFCEGGCTAACPYIITEGDPTSTPPTGDPTATPPVTGTSTPPPEVTSTPGSDPTKEPRENCNRGVGNSGNDCDPGNSSGQGQGGGRPAGEDRDENDTGPGNSGNNDNQNDKGK